MGLNSFNVFDGSWQSGYPYTVELNSSLPFWAMCDDYYHDGTPGDIWLANLTNLGTGNLTNLRFASSGLVAYEEAAWILLQTRVTLPPQWTDMNYAVWSIFNPTVVIDQQAEDWIDLAEQEARKKFQGVNLHLVEIATPVDIDAPPTGDQEFIWITPEPGSLILLGSGVVGIAFELHRKWAI